MTYYEARKWLDRIGGEWAEGKEQVKGTASIIVTVQSVKHGLVSRRAVFDDNLGGYPREIAIQRAFVHASEELRLALK